MNSSDWQVGDAVRFPTNADTIADDVDGREGVVIKVGLTARTRRGNRPYLRVSVDGHYLAVEPSEVEKID